MRKQVALVVVVLANGLSAGPLGVVPGGVARAATDCLAAPNAQSPQGSHWYYRVDRVNKRRCWYLGPQGGKVRPDASQVASPDLRRTAPPQSKPTATTPVEQQPTADAIVQPSNAVPTAEATFGQGSRGLSPPASDQPQPPGPDGREVALTSTPNSDAPSKANPEEEMPPIWPVHDAAELAATEQPAAVKPVYVLAVLAGAFALAGFVGRAIFKHAAARRSDRLHATDRPARHAMLARESIPPLGRYAEAAHWADIAHERFMTRDPPREVKEALHRLARASGATRREQRAPTAWETTSSQ
jgi:hypothetical protein